MDDYSHEPKNGEHGGKLPRYPHHIESMGRRQVTGAIWMSKHPNQHSDIMLLGKEL